MLSCYPQKNTSKYWLIINLWMGKRIVFHRQLGWMAKDNQYDYIEIKLYVDQKEK